MNFHNSIVLLGTTVIASTFLMALIYTKKQKPVYFKFVFGIIITGLLLSLNTITSKYYAWRYNLRDKILYEQVLTLVQTLFISLIFYSALKHIISRAKLAIILLLMVASQVIIVYIVHIKNIEIRQNIIFHILMIVFTFCYLDDVMNNRPTMVLSKSPQFWIIMGIFFSSCIGLPISTLVTLIPRSSIYQDIRDWIFPFYNVGIIILFLFIIKSYLCLGLRRNS